MTVEYPKYIYAAFVDHGTEDEVMVIGDSPEDLEDTVLCFGERSVKVARYALVGTGVIQQDSPYYTEDAHS